MSAAAFLRTIYLGDRACKGIEIDCWNTIVRLHIDCISRIRDPNGSWNYYTEEDIEDGRLVFADVQAFVLRNDGFLPNDYINDYKAIDMSDGSSSIEISISAVTPSVLHHETFLRIDCRRIYLEDPKRPGLAITI